MTIEITSESDLMSLISQMYHDKKNEVYMAGKKPDTQKIFSYALNYALNSYGYKFGFKKVSQIKSAFAKWKQLRKASSKASV